MTPKRGPECPPTVTLEAFSVGDHQELAAHVAGCEDCSAYVASLRAEADAFLRQRPPELFLKQVNAFAPSNEPRRWWRPALILSLGIAAALLFMALPRATPEVTLKGSALRVLRHTPNNEVQPLSSGTHVQAGDVVRLTYSTASAGWLVVAQLDGTETAVARFNARVEAGTTALPDALEFDDAAGPEWFVAIWAPEQRAVETLLSQLKGQAKHPRLSLECRDCRVEAIRLEKP